MKNRYSWNLCAILPVLQHQSISQKVWYYGKSRALVIFPLKRAASDLNILSGPAASASAAPTAASAVHPAAGGL